MSRLSLWVTGALIVAGVVFWFLNNSKEPVRQIDEELKSASQDNSDGGNIKDAKTAVATERLIKYVNDKYHYEIFFPNTWRIITDSSESNAAETLEGEISFGGEVVWSNHPDVKILSVDNLSKNAYLLRLVVYSNSERNMLSSIDDLARELKYDINSKIINLKPAGTVGKKFILFDSEKNKKEIVFVFRKDSLFYVFNLNFIKGDDRAVYQMESVVETFRVNNSFK